MARWLCGSVVGGVVAVLVLGAGNALAFNQGNAPSYSSAAPDPVSAQVVINGTDQTNNAASANSAQFLLCFNKALQTISDPSTLLSDLRLVGYGGLGGDNADTTPTFSDAEMSSPFTQSIQLGSTFTVPDPYNPGQTYSYTASVASNGQNPDCVNITITPASGTNTTFTSSTTTVGTTTYTSTVGSSGSTTTVVTGTSTTTGPGTVTETGSTQAPGFDLNSFTEVNVSDDDLAGYSGSASNLPSTPNSVALQSTGTPEVTPQSGGSSGPKLISIIKTGAAPNQIVYVFDYNLNPSMLGYERYYGGFGSSTFNPCASSTSGCKQDSGSSGGGFCYYTTSGIETCASSAAVSNNEVIATFANPVSVNSTYYEVYPYSVFTQTQEVPNVTTARGGTMASIPTLQNAAPVAGDPGTYDLTYDQAVQQLCNTCFAAVLEDNSVVNSAAISRPSSNSAMIRVSFGSVKNFSSYASKVVKIIDNGCAVMQQSSPNNCSALGEAAVQTPANEQAGYQDGPNLIGFSVNKGNSTATFTFDNLGGPLEPSGATGKTVSTKSYPVLCDFGLLYADGTDTFDSNASGGSFCGGGSSATFTGPNQVTIQFNPSQLSQTVVAGLVGDYVNGTNGNGSPSGSTSTSNAGDYDFAVADYQDKGNVSPLASGIGLATNPTTTGTSGSSGSSGSTNSTRTVTSTSTITSTTSSGGKHVSGKVGIASNKLKVKGGKVWIPITCNSKFACFGKLSITYHVTTRHHHKVTAVCTKPRNSNYRVGAHQTKTVKLPLMVSCLRAIARHHHHLGAKLSSRPRSGQTGVIKLVTLL